MKNNTAKLSKILLFCLFTIFVFSPTFNAQKNSSNDTAKKSDKNKPVKRALLIGVKGYSRGNEENVDWTNLATENDVNGLAEILGNADNQFRFDKIKILNTKETTTRKNILETIKTFLIDQTNEGDIVFLHFSGHGSQVSDKEKKPGNLKIGDEFDELDETLVPSDYISRADGSNDIRDDEIEKIIEELQKKKPLNITFSFDSCFSGTISRAGNSLIRGGGRSIEIRKEFGENESPSGLFTRTKDGKTGNGLIILSAARYDQSANEVIGQGGGAYSKALINALRKADQNTTYRDLYDAIVSDVTSSGFLSQYPQIEGNPNQKLMSNTLFRREPSFRISIDKNNNVILQSGFLAGISENSVFDIYEQGKTSKNGKPIFKNIKAKNVTALQARLDIQPDAPQMEKLKTARAFKTSHNFGDMRLKVSEYDLDADAKEILKILDTDKVINLVEQNKDNTKSENKIENAGDLRICEGKCPDEINSPAVLDGRFFTIQRINDGSVIKRFSLLEFKPENISELLENEARWRFFNKLETSDAKLNLKLRIVPVDCVKKGRFCEQTKDLDSQLIYSDGGNIFLKEEMFITFDVLNLSDEDIFVSIINTNEFGELSSFYPHYGYQIGVSGENRFSPKKDEKGEPVWQRIPLPFLIKIKEPFGKETFRAIATRQQTDFTSLLTRDGKPNTPFGELIKTLIRSNGTRNPDEIIAKPIINVELDPNDWGSYSIPFISVKK